MWNQHWSMSSACVSSAGVACGGRRADKQLRWDAAGEIMALNEGFKFHRILGSGAYGMVCEVTDMKKGVKYAVKKCFNIFKSQSVALRTLREIRLLRLMRHVHTAWIMPISIIVIQRFVCIGSHSQARGGDRSFPSVDIYACYTKVTTCWQNILQLDGGANFNDLYLVLELMETDLSKIIHSGQELSDAHLEVLLVLAMCIFSWVFAVLHGTAYLRMHVHARI